MTLSEYIAENRLAIKYWAVFTGTALLLLLIFNVIIPGRLYNAKANQSRQNLHSLQLAVERFAVDQPDESYPRHFDSVLENGYLEGLPENPFTGEPVVIHYRDPAESGGRLAPGDVLYERHFEDGKVASYSFSTSW